MKSPVYPLIRSLILSALLASGSLWAADSDPAPMPERRDAVLEGARDALARKDWAGAQGILRGAVQKNPGNADYHNLYAYAIRKGSGPDMSLVFKHYNQALSIDPKHRGAHEYLGEAYLMVGNVAKAKEHLATLDKLCFFPCSEHTDLKNAIAEHESKRAAR